MQFRLWLKLSLCLIFAAGTLIVWQRQDNSFTPAAQVNQGAPTNSSPIAVTPDNRFVWVANPDNNSVSVINVQNDANQKVAEVAVGVEPNNLAITPNGQFVYVANTVSGTISVIANTPANPQVVSTILAGTEPYGLAFTPNGRKLYVTNARSNNVSVIDPATNAVVKTLFNVGPEPRGIAITNDGDSDDNDEKVYVTQFLSTDRPGTTIGADDYKEGRVTVISTATDEVIGQVVLSPMADTGFRSNGSALKRIPAVTPPAFTVTTGAFPNMLNSVVIKGNRAYLPNNAASPDGPVRFNVNVQAFLSVIDTTTDTEGQAGGQSQTINMNRGINFEPAGPNKLFLGVPWQIAFKRTSNEGLVIAAAANIAVRVVLDAQGTPTINAPKTAADPGNIVRIPVGQNPQGIALNSTDTRAFVMNAVSRDVSVVNLATNQVIATVRSADLPQPGTLAATVQYGKAIFNSSAGVNLPTLGPVIPVGRLSSEGWSGCVSCHPNGLTDAVVWIFGAGPRRAIPLNGTFNPQDPNDIKILNYSAIFDEVQDFENNIRGVSGGLGLITLSDGVTPDPVLNAFNPADTGRSAALDAMAAFVARGIRTPVSPLARVSSLFGEAQEIAQGRELFEQAGCVRCHAGGGWSVSRRDYTPPPAASEIVNGQLIRFLRPVGTFDPGAVNEIRQNGAPPLGADGFNPPSLLGVFAMGPLFHNGSALTLDGVLDNVTHRRAGLGFFLRDPLNDRDNRAALVKFLQSIDASTQPFPIR